MLARPDSRPLAAAPRPIRAATRSTPMPRIIFRAIRRTSSAAVVPSAPRAALTSAAPARRSAGCDPVLAHHGAPDRRIQHLPVGEVRPGVRQPLPLEELLHDLLELLRS